MADPNKSPGESGRTGNSAPAAERGRGILVFSCSLGLLPLCLSFLLSMKVPTSEPLAVTREQPSLVFNDYLIHFGRTPVPAQPVLTPTFMFRNVGLQNVTLQKAIPSCGCIQPELTVSELAPGESGRLVVPIRTFGEQPGYHEYTVNVRYSDPKPREVTLTIKAVLPQASVLVEPKSLLLIGKFSESMEHEVSIVDGREAPLSVRDDLLTSSPFVSARIVRKSRDADGSRTVVGVRVSESIPAGNQRALLHVQTSDPLYPILQVPLLVRTPEPTDRQVIKDPELINMEASLTPRKPTVLDLTFPKAWKMDQIDIFPQELEVEFAEQPVDQADQQKLRLTLRFSSLPVTALQHGVVTLMANESKEMISVPIQFVWGIKSGRPL